MSTQTFMACGHSANATSEGKPCCILCVPDKKAYEVVPHPPDLAGRIAECVYKCGSKRESNYNLAFFNHTPNLPTDNYYCGCYGWD